MPDTGGGDTVGGLPGNVLDQLNAHGQKGVVISGLIAWMEVQMNIEGCDIWRALVERNWSDSEVTLAKEALRSTCGDLLETLVPEFKTKRQKKEKEVEDIRKAIVALQTNNSMPLVLASSGMMSRCPSAWGQPATATTQDLMGKVHMLEEVMSSHMELQRKQMEKLSQEVAAVRNHEVISKVPIQAPRITVDLEETPSKKRKFTATSGQPSYAAATAASVSGVEPIGAQQHLQGVHGHTQQQSGLRVLQEMFQQQMKPKPMSRSPRNICFGSAKSSGDQGVETMLAADVDLVASGVGKGCSDDDLKEFLKGKGIDAVLVETLTRQEVLDQVRTKTFKITVKASQYEAALKPEVWPYRVAVRHYRAPRRQDTTWSGQSERAGGLVDKGGQGPQQKQPGQGTSLGLKYLPVGHPLQKQGQHQGQGNHLPDPRQLSNFFGLLGQLGSQEISSH